MEKIPTLYQRDPEDMSRLIPEVSAGCEWVLAGEGVATRKYDGHCVKRDGYTGEWYSRRQVKAGRTAPLGFEAVEVDPWTGKAFGWIPMWQSQYGPFLAEAVHGDEPPGTYELCGPKVASDPEGFGRHVLVRHAEAERVPEVPTDFDGLMAWLATWPHEGLVWHHEDGLRMAKVKVRDRP